MIPVRQSKYNTCVQACVASLLELPLSNVPEFKPETWGQELTEWLHPRGWSYMNVRLNLDDPRGESSGPSGYTMGYIPAAEGFVYGWGHSVVCRDGLIVFDPWSGDQPGDKRADEYTILYPLDAASRFQAPYTQVKIVPQWTDIDINAGPQLSQGRLLDLN